MGFARKEKEIRSLYMNDKSLMPFGIHKGKQLANVPDDYLLFLHDNKKCYGELKTYIDENIDAIRENIKRTKKH